ncbi:retrovirus-related pol polyprotein from transposon TNT 1-94 [Tanacetum coccineum]|uniref:Retrovirus-related pol polyprotein from transposon TNT 1-94 n=1 Tax=Tanacetum coccineum TaxID=301880 RepID=A0ABQ4ZF48_9ASTR
MSTLVNTSSTEISVVKQKYDELVKKSLLTRSQFEGELKEKTKVISDLKVKEGKDIDTMIEMDKQIKFLNEILYKRNQSIQTIHHLVTQMRNIPYDTSDPANRFCPNGEETVTLEKESRSKLDKDTVKPYNYTYQNSLYETFKPPSKAYLDQLERAKEVRKTMWRKTFVRTKPNIAKNMYNSSIHCMTLDALSPHDGQSKAFECNFCGELTGKLHEFCERSSGNDLLTEKTDIRHGEFLNKTLHAYFKEEGIEHQTSTPRTGPEHKRACRNTKLYLVEAARTMLSASKLPLSFWAEAVATACYTQNRSIIISTHEKDRCKSQS